MNCLIIKISDIMGTNCSCCSRDEQYETLKIFWNGLLIQKITPYLYNCSVIENLNKGNIRNKEVLKKTLIKSLLVNRNYLNISKRLFEDALDYFENEIEEFIITIVLLTMNDNMSATKITFKKLIKYYKPEYLKPLDETYEGKLINTTSNNKIYIKKKDLFKIIKIYVKLVSLFSVKYLADLSKDKEYFLTFLTCQFSEDNQNVMINFILDKYVENELICIDDFLDNEISCFSDTDNVRKLVGQSGFMTEQNSIKKFYSNK